MEVYIRVLVSGNDENDVELCIRHAISICSKYANSSVEMVLS